ncbi:hypothetical protein GGR52DRAFT_586096 [Hypoxylon sp. FL1284]|nr:hypothetical protein GGR52DRAFT_586096 [Hypoxylon sp. FL1284]
MAAAVATAQSVLPFQSPSEAIEQTVSKPVERHDVQTSINYYKDPGDGSLPMPIVIAENTVRNERPHTPRPVVVRDVTGEEDRYALDSHGFQFVARRSALSGLPAFQDDALVRAEYYPECAGLVRDVTGASRVFIFDHKTRCGPTNWHKLGKGNRSSRGPLMRAHVDQSYAGAELVLRRWFPDEADALLKRRYQIINIWRPIKPILKDPLAVADATTLADADLLGAAIEYPAAGDRDETWTVRPGAAHRWYYKRAQRPAEALLIKCFDSDAAVPARRAPHTAFEDPAAADAEPRESVEARALVFYD